MDFLAAGLSHMLNSKPKAFHRDIKSANILLVGRSACTETSPQQSSKVPKQQDRHGTAKMADFGLSCTSSHANSLPARVLFHGT